MKLKYIALSILFASAFTSCKKDRTCTCSGTAVTTTGSSTSSATFSARIEFDKVKKAEAETECIRGTTTETHNGTTTKVTQTCDLD